MNIHCEFSSRFHSDSKRIRSGFESKGRESPRIHNVFAQQYMASRIWSRFYSDSLRDSVMGYSVFVGSTLRIARFSCCRFYSAINRLIIYGLPHIYMGWILEPMVYRLVFTTTTVFNTVRYRAMIMGKIVVDSYINSSLIIRPSHTSRIVYFPTFDVP